MQTRTEDQSGVDTVRGDPLGWWRRLTAPSEPPPSADFDTRERARRGRLASVLLLVLVLMEMGAVYQYVIVDDDHPAMKLTLACAFIITVLAATLNRAGRVAVAGLLLVALADLPLPGIPATAVAGQLDVLHLGAFYLLAGSVVVAASVLPPWSVFPVAAINSVASLALIAGMAHTPTLAKVLASNDSQQAFAGPVVMQAIVAIVAYLWARNVLIALRRADRAEEVALLERRELERSHALEEDVQRLLAVHVQMANGNVNVRVPPLRNGPLWQIGNSLNTLLARFTRLAQTEHLLWRTQAEAHQLAEAVYVQRSGRQPVWPQPAGTPLDEVVMALGTSPLPQPPSNTQASGRQSGSLGSGKLPVSSALHQPAARAGATDTSRGRPEDAEYIELPEWLRPR